MTRIKEKKIFPCSDPLGYHSSACTITGNNDLYISYEFDKWSCHFCFQHLIFFFFCLLFQFIEWVLLLVAQRRFKEFKRQKNCVWIVCVWVSLKRRQPHWNGVKRLTPKMKWKYIRFVRMCGVTEGSVQINNFMTCYRLPLQHSHHFDRIFVLCAVRCWHSFCMCDVRYWNV